MTLLINRLKFLLSFRDHMSVSSNLTGCLAVLNGQKPSLSIGTPTHVVPPMAHQMAKD